MDDTGKGADMADFSLRKRIMDRVQIDPASGCWIWTGSKYPSGRGRITVAGRRWTIYRATYTEWIGPIPEGLVLDHFVCERGECCNPEHVRPATQRENVLRGDTISSRAAAARACPAGHEYSGTNLYIRPNGKRHCRACDREIHRRQRARRVPRERALVTHCRAGHEYAGANLYITSAGKRQCRACHAATESRRYHRLREAAAA